MGGASYKAKDLFDLVGIHFRAGHYIIYRMFKFGDFMFSYKIQCCNKSTTVV